MGSVASFKRTNAPTTLSPALRAWWRCNSAVDLALDSTGLTLADSSGYGNHASPNFAPAFRPNQAYIVSRTWRPTTPNGFVYEVTVAGTAGAEPAWPTTPGNTVVTGGVTFTCRTPAIDRTTTDRVTLNLQRGEICHPLRPRFLEDVCFARPGQGGLSYTSNTFALTSASRILTDSASGLGSFAAGDWVEVGEEGMANGFTADKRNNGCWLVSAAVAGQLTFTSPFGPNANATAGDTVKLRKTLPPQSIVVSAWVKKINAATGMDVLTVNEALGTISAGFRCGFSSTHFPQMNAFQGDGTFTSFNQTSAISTATDVHVTWVFNRGGDGNMYGYVNGSRTTSTAPSNKGHYGIWRSSPLTEIFTCLFGSAGSVGQQLWDIQVYAYPGAVPSGLTGSGAQAAVQQMMAGTPLTPAQWS